MVDVSGSMCTAADVKNDDGDKVSLGFCLLDIAKHATNTFISSLEDDDYVAVVTYGSQAAVHIGWTKCDDAGRSAAIERVNQMHINGSTNLVAGVTTGFGQFEQLPLPTAQLASYSQHLVVCTDGQPDQRMDYAPLVAQCQDKLVAMKGNPAARVNVSTIGLGNSLDSQLLLSMADQFLHMPDPGAVGPFMVNLLANARATAIYDGIVANRATLVVKPASALAAATKKKSGGGMVRRMSSGIAAALRMGGSSRNSASENSGEVCPAPPPLLPPSPRCPSGARPAPPPPPPPPPPHTPRPLRPASPASRGSPSPWHLSSPQMPPPRPTPQDSSGRDEVTILRAVSMGWPKGTVEGNTVRLPIGAVGCAPPPPPPTHTHTCPLRPRGDANTPDTPSPLSRHALGPAVLAGTTSSATSSCRAPRGPPSRSSSRSTAPSSPPPRTAAAPTQRPSARQTSC